jgi:hypothetical protein
MHEQAEEWVKFVAKNVGSPTIIMDQGGRNINGSIKQHFPPVQVWLAIDITDGDGVTVVADCAEFVYNDCDVVTCTELFEHTPKVPEIIKRAYMSLRDGGHYIITTAGLDRPPHNAHGLENVLPGEYYQNINPYWLLEQLEGVGFKRIIIDVRDNPSDVRAWCIK